VPPLFLEAIERERKRRGKEEGGLREYDGEG
jgi:hypothetical protein